MGVRKGAMNARMRVLLGPSKQLVSDRTGWEVGAISNITLTGQLSPQPPRLGSIDGHGGWTEPDRVGGERGRMPTISGEAGGLVARGGRGWRAGHVHGREGTEDRIEDRTRGDLKEGQGRRSSRKSQEKTRRDGLGRHRDMTCRKILRPPRDKTWLLRGNRSS